MPANLHVRNVDDRVIRKLKARAVANGRSAEAEHRALLETLLDEDDGFDWQAVADELRRATADRPQTPSEVLVRETREEN